MTGKPREDNKRKSIVYDLWTPRLLRPRKITSSRWHFANLTPEELEILEQWIDAGVPEK